jgi:nucleotide-binding universal stress UspA family protein
MKTIVVAYDESEPAKRALERAAELAKAFGAKVVVTSVAPMLAASARGLGAVDPADSLELHQQELQHAKAFLAERGIDAALQSAIGDPASTIVEVAEKEGADLIVVGTGEPGFLERLFGGSVSAGVSHRAHCDVLIVH